MPVMNVAKFERFFRLAASLDVDKADLKRYNEFINEKIYDLLLPAQATAKANGRDIIQPADLPITRGLQENMQRYRHIDEQIELQPILDDLAPRPQLDLDYSDEAKAELPKVAGGLSVALAQALKIIEPNLKNPHSEHWERACQIFNLIL